MSPVGDAFVVAGEFHFHYNQWGEPGPPIVCVHGLTANVFCFPLAIPRACAIELILTAGCITAREVHQLGLVNHVMPASELMQTAKGIAGQICANARLRCEKAWPFSRGESMK